MTINIINKLKNSTFSDYINKIEKLTNIRPLRFEEVALLIRQGNFSTDWSKINVSNDFKPEYIWNNFFVGNVTIGKMDKNSGIFFSTIQNSTIGDFCFIKDVKLINNYFIDNYTVISNCGELAFEDYREIIIGKWIQATNEVKSRQVLVYEDLLLDEAKYMALYAHKEDIRKRIDDANLIYNRNLKLDIGYVGEKVLIKNSGEIKNTYISSGTKIENISALRNSVIWGSIEEPVELRDGVLIEESLIQWGAKVESLSIVKKSIMLEYSTVERHGKLTLSILGPNSVFAEGEITSSFCGPFVAMHHQSLLVAAFWPEGKGNIGYGANIGSNHTAKAPDQEIWIGEGMFWGLGVNIKFPGNTIKAPYSIVATGVLLLPQKIEMPFSLINLPQTVFKDVSPAYNEIIPGWVLSDDLFMILRNSIKYKKRDKARRNKLVYEIFRKDIMEYVLSAREKLQNVKEIKEYYTYKDIEGIGKNYLLEKNRLKGIETYTFFLSYYALLRFYEKFIEIYNKKDDFNSVFESSGDAEYDFAIEILKKELPDLSIKDYLNKFIEYKRIAAEDILKSKQKDDIRGEKIIDDYREVMVLAEHNDFVNFIMNDLRFHESKVKEILDLL